MELKPETARLDYLDSTRGIAAMMVFVGHYISLNYPEYLPFKFASLGFNALDAVSFFFVLSGMVLSYPYFHLNKKLDIGQFYVTRIFRIYPAYLLVLIANALYAFRYELGAGLSGFMDLFVYNKYSFWEEACLIRGTTEHYSSIFNPGWTLTIEMGFSFLMPFIILIGRIDRKYMLWLLLVAFLASNIVREFFVHFILGVCLTLFFCDIQKESFKNTFLYKYRAFIIPIFILLFSLRHISRIHEIGSSLINLMNFVGLTFFCLSGLAAFVFLIYIIRFKKVQAFLMHPILLFYGRISYGIYLGHWILLRIVGDYWKSDILPAFPNKVIAFIVVFLICFILSSLLAVLLHYFVELPFIKIGKKLIKKMKPTMSI